MVHTMYIPLSNAQVAGILTTVEFVLTGIVCLSIKVLFIMYKRRERINAEATFIHSTTFDRFMTNGKVEFITSFSITTWMVITVFLLELNLKLKLRRSADTLKTQYYLNMSSTELQSLDIGSTDELNLPRNFKIDAESINTVREYPCEHGIAQVPLYPRNSPFYSYNSMIYPNCNLNTDTMIEDKNLNEISRAFRYSYIDGYNGLNLKANLFVIPESVLNLETSYSNETKIDDDLEYMCSEGKTIILVLGNSFNYSWDIGFTNNNIISKLVLSRMCRTLNGYSCPEGLPCRSLLHAKFEKCFKRTHGYDQILQTFEDSIDHNCIKSVFRQRNFQNHKFQRVIQVGGLSVIDIPHYQERQSVSNAKVCFNATVTYNISLIPFQSFEKFYCKIGNNSYKFCTESNVMRIAVRRGENSISSMQIFGARSNPNDYLNTSTRKQLRECLPNRNCTIKIIVKHDSDYHDLDLIALPTAIRVTDGTCLETNSLLGLAALTYSVTSAWEKTPNRDLMGLTLEEKFQAFLLSLSRSYFDSDSFLPVKNNRTAATFLVSRYFTGIDADVYFYLNAVTFLICLIIPGFTVTLYLWNKSTQSM